MLCSSYDVASNYGSSNLEINVPPYGCFKLVSPKGKSSFFNLGFELYLGDPEYCNYRCLAVESLCHVDPTGWNKRYTTGDI